MLTRFNADVQAETIMAIMTPKNLKSRMTVAGSAALVSIEICSNLLVFLARVKLKER